MSVITQSGDTVLMLAATGDRTEVVSLLLKAGANTDLQNKVYRIALIFRGSLISRISRIWNRSRN